VGITYGSKLSKEGGKVIGGKGMVRRCVGAGGLKGGKTRGSAKGYRRIWDDGWGR